MVQNEKLFDLLWDWKFYCSTLYHFLFHCLNFGGFHHFPVFHLNVQGFQQEMELHFFGILHCCFWDWHIPTLYCSCYERGQAKEHLNLFGTIYSAHLQSFCLLHSRTISWFCYYWYTFLTSSLRKQIEILLSKKYSFHGKYCTTEKKIYFLCVFK